MKAWQSILDNVIKAKQKRVVEQTVVEFQSHTLAEKGFRAWRIYMCLQKRKKLQNQCADEFYQDLQMKQKYRYDLETTCN
jgi:hypothetical protein